jgi:septal ring factor EnvC (AmiA/AmiB activator)
MNMGIKVERTITWGNIATLLVWAGTCVWYAARTEAALDTLRAHTMEHREQLRVLVERGTPASAAAVAMDRMQLADHERRIQRLETMAARQADAMARIEEQLKHQREMLSEIKTALR